MKRQSESYEWEFFVHPTHTLVMMYVVALATIISVISIKGAGIFLISSIVAEALAFLFVPSNPLFMNYVNHNRQKKELNSTRSRLKQAVFDMKNRSQYDSNMEHVAAYRKMVDRIDEMYEIAEDPSSKLSFEDVFQIDKSTIKFLACLVSLNNLDIRTKESDHDSVKQKIESIKQTISETTNPSERNRLERALKDYQNMLDRISNLKYKKLALEATLITLPDQIEELYQMILVSPQTMSESVLSESLSRLRMEESIENELNVEIEGLQHSYSGSSDLKSKKSAFSTTY